jgi:hypothetical protein
LSVTPEHAANVAVRWDELKGDASAPARYLVTFRGGWTKTTRARAASGFDDACLMAK